MGIVLLGLCICLILVPVSLGGTGNLPWDSVGVVGLFIAGGFVLLIFIIWEAKVAKNPFMAHELFVGKTRTFTTVLFIDFVAGMGLYASLIFWVSQASAECYLRDPSMSDSFFFLQAYTVKGVWGGTPMEVGIYSIPGGFGLARTSSPLPYHSHKLTISQSVAA